MAYVSHNARLARTPARLYSGVATIAGGGLMAVRGNWEKSGNLRNRFGAFDRITGGTPSGLRHPAAWIMAPVNGGMASRNEISATATLTGAGARGVNGTVTITATSDLAGTGQLVVSGVASITATGTLTGTVVAALAASAALTAEGALVGALLAKGNATALITASGTLTAPNYGTGSMSASISNASGDLTPESISVELLDVQLVETGMTVRETLRLAAAALGGKVSGAGTGTEVFRNAVADSKNRITATVDSSGNRTAIVTDLA